MNLFKSRGLAACGRCASQNVLKALALALLMLVINVGVLSAQEPVSYLSPVYNTPGQPNSGINHWETLSCTSYTLLTSDMNTWGEAGTDTWYVCDNQNPAFSDVTCVGNVHLILVNGCYMSTETIIETGGDGNSFTIYAQDTAVSVMGTLNADGTDFMSKYEFSAGIGGGGDGQSGSNITINGGNINAFGGGGAAGIGGGDMGEGSNIIINGGKVYTYSFSQGAGIGGGNQAAGSNIIINGGNVYAYSLDGGDGIGAGYNGSGSNIFVADNIILKADSTDNPTVIIAHASITTDIADSLAGKCYVTAVEPKTPSSVDEAEMVEYVAYSEGMSVLVNGVGGKMVYVYDMNGKLVKVVQSAQEVERINVHTAGVYIVRVDNKTTLRVVVK